MKEKSIENKMGIYIIRNTIDSRIYIGSALHINYRKNVHWCQLKKGNHHSRHLQRFFNKYGIDVLKFDILEKVTDKSQLNKREQYYIDFYNSVSPNGFNIRSNANTNFGIKHSLESIEKRKQTFLKKGGFYHHNDETKKRISDKMKLLKKTPEHCINLSKARKASKYIPNNETREKHRLRMLGKTPNESTVLKRSKPFSIINPNGKLINGINFRKFCRNNNLAYSPMYKVLHGTMLKYKGYKTTQR